MKKVLLLLTIASIFGCNTENKTNTIEDPEVLTTTIDKETDGHEEYLSYDASRSKLKWTAYKTPEKVAVQGTFDSIVVNNTTESLIPEDILEGANFTVYTSSLTTGDESRDAKIIGLFFNNLEDNLITGTFGKFENQVVPIDIVMNGVKARKDFKYTFENKKIIITGVVDVLEDFNAQNGFDILHEACSTLHLDKTWTDVSLEVIADLETVKP